MRPAHHPRVPELPVRPELHQEHDGPQAGDPSELLQVPDPPRHRSAPTRCPPSARPSRKSACPSVLISSRCRSCSTPPAMRDLLECPRQGHAGSALQQRHPRQRTGRAGNGRPGSAGRRPTRSRQGPQGSPHAHRQPGDQGPAAIFRAAHRSIRDARDRTRLGCS